MFSYFKLKKNINGMTIQQGVIVFPVTHVFVMKTTLIVDTRLELGSNRKKIVEPIIVGPVQLRCGRGALDVCPAPPGPMYGPGCN